VRSFFESLDRLGVLAGMANPVGESIDGALRLDFDRRLSLQFRGSMVTSDAGCSTGPDFCSLTLDTRRRPSIGAVVRAIMIPGEIPPVFSGVVPKRLPFALDDKICSVSFTNAASADANADDASDGATRPFRYCRRLQARDGRGTRARAAHWPCLG
jgi:hypothetical protein